MGPVYPSTIVTARGQITIEKTYQNGSYLLYLFLVNRMHASLFE
jgi:hypothetical protein